MTDYSATIAAIEQASTLSNIQEIVGQYSAQAVGPGGILYSGYVGSIPAGTIAQQIVSSNAQAGVAVNILDNTPRGLLLSDSAVQSAIETAVQNLYIAQGLNTNQALTAAENFLFGSAVIPSGDAGSLSSSLWGQASGEFASSLSGDITVIGTASQANPARVFANVEIPALLDNPNVTSIGGIAGPNCWRQVVIFRACSARYSVNSRAASLRAAFMPPSTQASPPCRRRLYRRSGSITRWRQRASNLRRRDWSGRHEYCVNNRGRFPRHRRVGGTEIA